MKLIITEEERSRILGMHQSATSRQYLMEEVLKGVALDLVSKITNSLNKKVADYKTKNPNVLMNSFTINNKGILKTKEGEMTKYTIYVGTSDLFGDGNFTDADLQPTTNRDSNLKSYRSMISNALNSVNLVKLARTTNNNLNSSNELQAIALGIFDTWAAQFKTPPPQKPGTTQPQPVKKP